MARIKIDLPESFSFQCIVPIRITDLNYGGHVGNDTILSIVHEARMQWLHQLGYTEMNMEGIGMIMADAGIEFKAELFYGDQVKASLQATNLSRIGFDLYYKLEKETQGKTIMVAAVKTAMVCYDYEKKKITSLPDAARKKMEI